MCRDMPWLYTIMYPDWLYDFWSISLRLKKCVFHTKMLVDRGLPCHADFKGRIKAGRLGPWTPPCVDLPLASTHSTLKAINLMTSSSKIGNAHGELLVICQCKTMGTWHDKQQPGHPKKSTWTFAGSLYVCWFLIGFWKERSTPQETNSRTLSTG